MVQGLTTGETYVFRVQAINELGLSDESQESSTLSVKAALSEYTNTHSVSFSYLIISPSLSTQQNEYACR